MLRVTDDLLELRQWVEARAGHPCRRPDGALALCFEAIPAPALLVDWGEFEATFVAARCVLVYDDAPGCNRCFVGPVSEAQAYVAGADPRVSGAGGPTP